MTRSGVQPYMGRADERSWGHVHAVQGQLGQQGTRAEGHAMQPWRQILALGSHWDSLSCSVQRLQVSFFFIAASSLDMYEHDQTSRVC